MTNIHLAKRQRRWAPQITIDKACKHLKKHLGNGLSLGLIGLTGDKVYPF